MGSFHFFHLTIFSFHLFLLTLFILFFDLFVYSFIYTVFISLLVYLSIHSFTCHIDVPLVTSTPVNGKDVRTQSPNLSLGDDYDVRLVCHKRDHCPLENINILGLYYPTVCSLTGLSTNLLAFYHECYSLFGYTTVPLRTKRTSNARS